MRRHLTYANLMSTVAVFLVLGGATAFAAAHLGRNSVGSKQLKRNSVTAAKIKNGAVSSAKLPDRSVTQAKIAASAVGGAQADEASFQGLIKGNGSQFSHTFTTGSPGFLPTPLILADIPSLGAQVELLFCGSFESSSPDQMRVRVRAVEGAPAFTSVNRVEASNLPAGTAQPEFVDFGAGNFADNAGEPLLAELPGKTEKPGPFGIAAQWDFQLFRGDDPNTTTAHVSVSAFNDSSSINQNGQCHISAETITQP